MRSCELNKSSMLPVMTMVGMADKNPVTKRPITRALAEGTAPIRRQKTLYKRALKT